MPMRMWPQAASTFVNCWRATTTIPCALWLLTMPEPDAFNNTMAFLHIARLAPMSRRLFATSTGASWSRSGWPSLRKNRLRLRQRSVPPRGTTTNPRGSQTTHHHVCSRVDPGDAHHPAGPFLAQVRLGDSRGIARTAELVEGPRRRPTGVCCRRTQGCSLGALSQAGEERIVLEFASRSIYRFYRIGTRWATVRGNQAVGAGS